MTNTADLPNVVRSHSTRPDFTVKTVQAPAGATIYRASWTHEGFTRGLAATGSRTMVRWFVYDGGRYVGSHETLTSAKDMLQFTREAAAL